MFFRVVRSRNNSASSCGSRCQISFSWISTELLLTFYPHQFTPKTRPEQARTPPYWTDKDFLSYFSPFLCPHIPFLHTKSSNRLTNLHKLTVCACQSPRPRRRIDTSSVIHRTTLSPKLNKHKRKSSWDSQKLTSIQKTI